MRTLTALALLGVASALMPSLASASTFYSSDTSTPGNNATLYAGYSATPFGLPPDGVTSPTYDIGTGGVWAAPIGPSSWVSFDPNTYPGGSYTAPNGYYDYKVNLDPSISGEIALTVLADDTTSVYLNDLHQLISEGAGPYPKCAVGQPNCVTAYTFDFFDYGNGGLLDFEVHQAAAYSTGLDFYGTTVTPEPGSLLLLGSGLLGGAGALLRRVRRA